MSRKIVGRVETGHGRAAGFTSLPWAKREIRRAIGIDPFPGTLNLRLEGNDRAEWHALMSEPGLPLQAERTTDCAARCYPILAGVPGRESITAGILVPDVPGYPADQIEVLAAVPLREFVQLADGDCVTLRTVPVRNRRVVLFDVDGTLVDSIDGYRLAAERAVQPYGWIVSREAVNRALNFGDRVWDMVVPAELLGDERLIAELRRDTMAHWPAVLRDSVPVFPGIGAMLAKLRSAGVRLGICTASNGESFRPLEQAGLLGYFEEIVTARDVTCRKPDPEGLLLCMERMGVQAGETVYVGDTVADVRAGNAAGLYAIGVLTGAGDSSLLSRAGAHRIVPDLEHLPEMLAGDQSV